MPSDVHADPEKLRQFAKTLSSSAGKIDEIARQLRRSLDATQWKDSERQRFEDGFKQTLKALSSVSSHLRDTDAPGIQKKAEALDRFRG